MERRKEKRKKVIDLLNYRIIENDKLLSNYGLLRDLSLNGASFLTSMPICVNKRMFLKFRQGDALGNVVWCKYDLENYLYAIGVKFDNQLSKEKKYVG